MADRGAARVQPSATPDGDGFAGFGAGAMGFLDGLAAENTKAWFDEHRSVYDADVAAPLKAFVVAVGDRLSATSQPALQYEPRVGRSLFRINRDLRFGNDPTPYHTHLDVVWWRGDHPRSSPAFICRIRPDVVRLGAGVMGMKGDTLSSYRRTVDRDGDRLAAIVTAIRAGVADDPSLEEIGASETTRARVPKPYPADHPHGEWLRRDGFHVSGAWTTPATVTDPSLTEWATERLEIFSPLLDWLADATEVGRSA